MKNKILKYSQFSKINEENDTPENYIKTKLMRIKKEIDNLFEESDNNDEENQPETISIKTAKKASNKSRKFLSGVELQSSEISLYSKTDDNLTVKYSDMEGVYNLLVSININNSLPKQNQNFSDDDIKKIYVKFKKYTTEEIDLIGQIDYTFDVDFKDGKFIFSLGKDESQEQQEEKSKKEFEGDLVELLEFLKSDFDYKYGENEGIEFETE